MLNGLFYVEFLTDTLAETQAYFERYGLRPAAVEEHGRGVWLKGEGVSIVVRLPTSGVDKAKLNRSGVCVTDIAFLVDNVDKLLESVREASKQVQQMNVTISVGLKSTHRYVQLFFPRPSLRHTLIECDDFDFMPDGWVRCAPSAAPGPPLVSFVDHIAIACLAGTMEAIIQWYEIAFSLKQKTGLITIKTGLGDGLRLGSLYHELEAKNETFVKLTFVESVTVGALAGENQVTTFLKNHGSPGVQHIAFLAGDIFHTRRELHQSGVQFLAAPPGYYQLPQLQQQADAAGISLAKLEEGGLLFDNEPEKMELQDAGAENKYLLQVFTRSPFPRDTCFFELISRGNHREGFGAANIRNLFKAVALEKRRKLRQQSGQLRDSAGSDTSVPRALGGGHIIVPVVIVGASVSALAMALALARVGVHSVLIGKQPCDEPSHQLMGTVAMHTWRRLGVADQVQREAMALSTLRLWDGSAAEPWHTQLEHVQLHQECVNVPTAALRAILLHELASLPDLCQVCLGCEVVALGEVEGHMAVHVEPERRYISDYVIDTGGLGSFWAAHLVSEPAERGDTVVSVNLMPPTPCAASSPRLQRQQSEQQLSVGLWLNPLPGVDYMVSVPLKVS
jgi:4-hydroxyphenylpyruvate dioxygenase